MCNGPGSAGTYLRILSKSSLCQQSVSKTDKPSPYVQTIITYHLYSSFQHNLTPCRQRDLQPSKCCIRTHSKPLPCPLQVRHSEWSRTPNRPVRPVQVMVTGICIQTSSGHDNIMLALIVCHGSQGTYNGGNSS